MLKALIIPNVLVANFTFLANHVASGLPSLTAVSGFGKSLALQATRNGVPATFYSTSIALRAPATCSGHARFMRGLESDVDDLRAATKPGSEGKILAPEIDDQKGSMLVDFMVLLQVEEENEADLTAEFLTQIVRAQRFSGAELRTPEGRPVSVSLFDDVQKALRSIPTTALMVEDASQTLLGYAEKSGRSLKDAFVALIAHQKKSLKEAQKSEEATGAPESESVDASDSAIDITPVGYFVPAATGFALLEAPVIREGVRAPGLLHAFAEPLLGLVRIRQVGSVRAQLRKSSQQQDPEITPPAVFWHMAAEAQESGVPGAGPLVYAKGYQ